MAVKRMNPLKGGLDRGKPATGASVARTPTRGLGEAPRFPGMRPVTGQLAPSPDRPAARCRRCLCMTPGEALKIYRPGSPGAGGTRQRLTLNSEYYFPCKGAYYFDLINEYSEILRKVKYYERTVIQQNGQQS